MLVLLRVRGVACARTAGAPTTGREASPSSSGPNVNGGQYGEYPSIEADKLVEGDLAPGMDFRGPYAAILDDWMGIDEREIVGGEFERPPIFKN